VSDQPNQSDLPFFGDYLRQVLKPRVESVLEGHDDQWGDMVWMAIAEAVAGGEAPVERVIELLRDRLGLRLDVKVEAHFDAIENAPQAEGDRGEGGAVEGEVIDGNGAEQVNVRRRMSISPLAAAVSSPKRK